MENGLVGNVTAIINHAAAVAGSMDGVNDVRSTVIRTAPIVGTVLTPCGTVGIRHAAIDDSTPGIKRTADYARNGGGNRSGIADDLRQGRIVVTVVRPSVPDSVNEKNIGLVGRTDVRVRTGMHVTVGTTET